MAKFCRSPESAEKIPGKSQGILIHTDITNSLQVQAALLYAWRQVFVSNTSIG